MDLTVVPFVLKIVMEIWLVNKVGKYSTSIQ